MRLEEKYTKEIKDALMQKYNYKSVMQIPKLDKQEKIQRLLKVRQTIWDL